MRYVLSKGSFCEYRNKKEILRALSQLIADEKAEYKTAMSKSRHTHKDLIADVKVTFYEGAKNGN